MDKLLRDHNRRAIGTLLLSGAIVLLGLALRWTALDGMPLFVDEGSHIVRAQHIAQGELFFGFQHSKWLYTALLALFRPLGPETPWLARGLSALWGALTIAGCIALGRALDEWRTGWLAGAIYALLPLAVFHERQALVDPQLAALTTLSAMLAVYLAARPRLWMGLLLSAALGAAILTKGAAALPYLLLPLAATLLLARSEKARWRGLALGGGAAALALAINALVVGLARRSGVELLDSHSALLENTILPRLADPATLAHLQSDLLDYFVIARHYAGWAVLGLVLLALVWAVAGERRRAILFLAIPALAFGLVPILAVRPTLYASLSTRYFLPTAAPLATLAALSLRLTLSRLSRWQPVAGQVGAALAALGLLATALPFDLALIRHPDLALLAPPDRTTYETFSATPNQAIAQVIIDEWRQGGREPVDVVGPVGIEMDFFRAYLGPRIGSLRESNPDDHGLSPALLEWAAAGQSVFFIEHPRSGTLPDSAYGAQIRLIAHYPSERGEFNLYRMVGVGVDGPQANSIYAQLVPGPDEMSGDYTALAAALAQNPAARPAIVFPASQAAALPDQANLTIKPLLLSRWPLDASHAREALARLDLGVDGEPVEAVLVDEAHADPGRAVALALQESLYQTGSEWYGLLHRVSYVSGPVDPESAASGVQYEGGIELVSAAILDPTPAPGGTLRLALEWRTPVEVQDSYVVFTHLVGQDETLWAQYDSVPGGGLLPMTSWVPGEPVRDRFAMRLPNDLPPGAYALRIGLYHPESGLRLRAVAGPEVGPDYAVLAHVVVGGAD
jgi:4-amino-4-deoxy-L-arabinose transferase-like glycosyltransferase